MRFLITSNIKNNPPLRVLVILFLIGSLLYWIAGWFFYHYKFGLTYEKMFLYFFADPSFPELLPPAQLLEDIHIQLFMTIVFLTVLTPVFLHGSRSGRPGKLLLPAVFLGGAGEAIASAGVYLLGPSLIYLKILLFILFQVGAGFMILSSLRVYLTGGRETAPERSLLYAVVLFFALSTILFTLVSFFLFALKLGLTPESVSEYYRGNPHRFMKPKSLSLLLEVITPHLLAMSLYVFALVHLAFFTNLRRRILWSLLLFSCALTENLSTLLIRFLWEGFSYLKIASFLGLCAGMLYLSVVLIVSLLRHRAGEPVVL